MMRSSFFLGFAGLTSIFGCGGDGPPPPTDVTLDPPAEGWQFEIEPFEVPEGEELQQCYFLEVPFDEDVCVGRIEVAQNPGTHHMNVFRIGTVLELDGEVGEMVGSVRDEDPMNPCWRSGNWADWPLVVNSQASEGDGYYDWTLPENVVHRFAAREKLMLQSHYVNASTQAGDRGKILVNFERVPCEGADELGTMFATQQSISICPGDTDVQFASSCGNGFTDPVTIVAANSHFHSRGTNFTIEPYDPVGGEYGEAFYTNTSWDDPLMATDLDFVLQPDQRIGWHCSYTYEEPQEPYTCADVDAINAEEDPTCCYGFGPVVEASEHCNIFVYYYPKVTDFSCN